MKHLEYALNANNQFWKYIVVSITTLLASNFIGILPLVITAFIIGSSNGLNIMDISENIMNAEYLGMSSNLSLFLMMIAFVVAFITLIVLVKLLHRQSIAEIINGTKKIRWSRILWGAGVWIGISSISLLIGYISNPENFTLQFNITSFIPLFFIAVIMIPIQTSYEELSFRGYLAQGIGRITKNRWIVLIIPSILFALMHAANPEVREYGFFVMMPNYLIVGLLFGLVSILDDGIELALGMHAANNVFLSLTATHASSALQTPAIFSLKEADPVYGIVEIIIFSIVIITFFYRKYSWNFSILNKRIDVE